MTHHNVSSAVFKDQLEAIQQRMKSLPPDEGELNKQLDEILDLLGRAWPLEGSAWDSSLLASFGEGASDDKRKKRKPDQVLKRLLEERGRTVFALSHSGRTEYRGMAGLGTDRWKTLHRAEFGRIGIEFLAGLSLPNVGEYREMCLNVLIVDNKPNEIFEYDEFLPPDLGILFWKNANCWKFNTDKGLDSFHDAVRKGQISEGLIEKWDLGTDSPEQPDLHEFDLVLQDQFLDSKKLSGTDFAELYYEVMPQAQVFLTTGLDVQSLVSLGHHRFVDRIIPKHHLAARPWYYYLAFTDVMGSMFWESWLKATDKNKEALESRPTLRALLGTLRRWQREPEILWHGQALAEMVDHGDAHISDLWRLSDQILGARKKTQELAIGLDKVTTAERVLLALGIWLHDIGHRGDDLTVDPPSIRDAHGSISERLVLQDPDAFGLGWIKRDGDDVAKRNETSGLTPLRQVGLLCRHHQSSAPLFADAVANLHYGLKFGSDYARVAWDGNKELQTDVLEKWRDDDLDLPWIAHDVRVLEDFEDKEPGNGPSLLKCACLLRLFDAIQLSRSRAGSKVRIETHRLYRKNRKEWAKKRKLEVQRLMALAPVGSKNYLELLKELLSIESYEDLLEVQDVHLWRQYVVHRCYAKYETPDKGKAQIRVTYELVASDKDLWADDKFKGFREALEGKYKDPQNEQNHYGELGVWREDFIGDVVSSEVKGQMRNGRTYLLDHVFQDVDLTFASSPGSTFYSLHESGIANEKSKESK